MDPVGPSPVIIAKAQLASLVDPWWALCLQLKRDRDADRAFGWVLEMWAWALTAARAGVRHTVLSALQAEPGNAGIRDLERFHIYHYTFDLAVSPGFAWGSSSRQPEWQWSKRHFMGNYPPRIKPPRSGAAGSTTRFIEMMNEAMDALSPWRPL